jgi:hydrogenase nickel incorporation protein HypA/HybF
VHEVGLIAEAIQRAEAAAAGAGARHIQRMTFSVIPGGHVTEEIVQTVCMTLTPGTMAENAEVVVEWDNVQRYCFNCQSTYAAIDSVECPTCGSGGTPAEDRPELMLTSIEVDGESR